jgi:hypothetical protein
MGQPQRITAHVERTFTEKYIPLRKTKDSLSREHKEKCQIQFNFPTTSTYINI